MNQSISKAVSVGFSAIAVVMVLFLAFISYLLNQLAEDAAHMGRVLGPQVDAAMEIRLVALEAHLLTEELMGGGDGSENPQDVFDLLAQARDFGRGLLEGGETSEGTVFPAESAVVRAEVERALQLLDQVESLTQARLASLDDAQGVGTGADERFDAEYDSLISDIGALSGSIRLAQNTGAQQALGEARYRLAHGHLITAEILGGDFGEDFAEVVESFAAAQDALQSLSSIVPQQEIGPLIERIRALSALAQERYELTLARVNDLAAGDAEYDAVFNEFAAHADEAESLVQGFISAELQAMDWRRTAGFVSFFVVAAMLATAAYFGYRLISKKVANRISELAESIEAVLGGDIEAPMPSWQSDNELGRLKRAITEFRAVLVRQTKLEEETQLALQSAKKMEHRAEVAAEEQSQANDLMRGVGQEIKAQSKNLNEISQHLSAQHATQAQLLENVSNVMASLSEIGCQNKTIADDAAEVFEKVKARYEEGLQTIQQISLAVDKVSSSAENIQTYLATIEEISFQTNLLALNASVEAARAGAAGQGFAIVAQEVRALASKTSDAATSIKDVITQTNSYISEGTQAVDAAQERFVSIDGALEELKVGMDSVGASSSNQMDAVASAASKVKEFSNGFGEAERLVHECYEVGQDLTERASSLLDMAPASDQERPAQAA